jgi:hypothetical protein
VNTSTCIQVSVKKWRECGKKAAVVCSVTIFPQFYHIFASFQQSRGEGAAEWLSTALCHARTTIKVLAIYGVRNASGFREAF